MFLSKKAPKIKETLGGEVGGWGVESFSQNVKPVSTGYTFLFPGYSNVF